MKCKLYTMLKVKSDYGLSLNEKVLLWLIGEVKLNDYIGSLIDLRDSRCIHEINKGEAVAYRTRYLTEKGYRYLSDLKKLYLKELIIKFLKWSLKHWYVALIGVLLGRCCS